MNKVVLLAAAQLSLAFAGMVQAQSPDGMWVDVRGKSLAESAFHYRGIATDIESLKTYLEGAPLEGAAEGLSFYYPRPDGGYLHLQAFYSPIMAPELEAKYPEIRTYKVVGVDDEGISGRIDTTPRGFHGYVNTPETVMVLEPEASFGSAGNISQYRGFFKEDAPEGEPLKCDTEEHHQDQDSEFSYLRSLAMPELAARMTTGDTYKVYKIAMGATGEFSASVSSDSRNPSVAETQAYIVTVINRVNQIYEKEVAARFQLVADNDKLIYTNSGTDPYSNEDSLLDEHQSNVDKVIGSDKYDIGHLLNQYGGGLAFVGVVCWDSYKAMGRTGLSDPDGRFEYFVTDLLAHELGHQFGAGHTFNANSGGCNGNRSSRSAWEVGSGSTIMSYSGLCDPQNIQYNADDYFHGGSLEQINDYLTSSTGASCGTAVNAGNTPPTVDAGADYAIPANTPFMLTAVANDVDVGDMAGLTYTWDQMDLGSATSTTGQMSTDDGSRPLFRSVQGTTSPTRYFPELSAIVSGDLGSSLGETLPTTDRELNFRVTARSGDFGVAQDDLILTVDKDSGPFVVTAPGAGAYSGGQQLDVTWNVANTDLAPVSCTQVDIELSKDGGDSFTTVITKGVSNDGFERVTMPNTDTGKGRVRVKCSDNVFFNISPEDFSLTTVNTSGNLSVTAVDASLAEGNSGRKAFTFRVSRQFAVVDMTIDYDVDGVGANPANAADFGGTLPSGTVRLSAGEFTKSFTIDVSGDTGYENSESFRVTISNPSSGIVAQASVEGLIENDDEKPTVDSGDSGDTGSNTSPSSDNSSDSSGGGAAWWLLLGIALVRLGARRR
ncbi:hypothetical protein BTA51_16280 [Hahella sp. CCB-MM4]|uniref:reprolysin-like metallopeptidase n=1 Tax=Hahella sp. (strain CCB-MM4) TaxID=1926491 RepID=UPI000B9AC1E1|nr:zinc-dependent metalloprotease family protein [Hahella sp. CCB-MM4]OZG72296.1 hypothetical protein BTA51_16280 [Hahella sp. CCB-MM4]